MAGGDFILIEDIRIASRRLDKSGKLKGDRNECAMDREYQYLFVGSPDHYDFLSHNTG